MSDITNILSVRGFKLLIAMPAFKDKTEGGIYLPDSHKDKESTASMYGMVVAMGPEAYLDKDKFPTGRRCEVNDWVLFKSFTGTRVRIKGQEFRLINDDSVDAVVADPRLIERA